MVIVSRENTSDFVMGNRMFRLEHLRAAIRGNYSIPSPRVTSTSDQIETGNCHGGKSSPPHRVGIRYLKENE